MSVTGDRQLRHILRYLLFPDSFERITVLHHKLEILNAIEKTPFSDLEKMDDTKIDQALLGLRQRLANERGSANFDFYDSEFKGQWKDSFEPLGGSNSATIAAKNLELIRPPTENPIQKGIESFLETFPSVRSSVAFGQHIQLKNELNQIRSKIEALQRSAPIHEFGSVGASGRVIGPACHGSP